MEFNLPRPLAGRYVSFSPQRVCCEGTSLVLESMCLNPSLTDNRWFLAGWESWTTHCRILSSNPGLHTLEAAISLLLSSNQQENVYRSLRPAWSTNRVLEQSELHLGKKKTVLEKKQKQNKKIRKEKKKMSIELSGCSVQDTTTSNGLIEIWLACDSLLSKRPF